MAEEIRIELFKLKNAGELTKALADPQSRLDTGGAAAMSAALAASLLERAAVLTLQEIPENERAEYIFRNAEILRNYMVHLIDEDIKCRHPLRRALREGGEKEIEAARETAVAIPGEIINMMHQALALAKELCPLCPKDSLHYAGECAEMAMAAIRSARFYILNMSVKSTDETYRFVARRENELTLKACEELEAEILAAAERSVSE